MALDEQGRKRCNRCGETKVAEGNFYRRLKHRGDGFGSICKPCTAEKDKARWAGQKELRLVLAAIGEGVDFEFPRLPDVTVEELEWQDRRSCRQLPGEWWTSEDPELNDRAKEVCFTSCPVRVQCAALAEVVDAGASPYVTYHERSLPYLAGVWAGETPVERYRRRRRDRNAERRAA